MSGNAALPAGLGEYVKTVVGLPPNDVEALLGGAAVAKVLDGSSPHEVAVFGAVWIDSPQQRYFDAVEDIETFERGKGFRITKKISDPPRVEDFDDLEISSKNIRGLQKCRVGDCNVKLSEPALKELQTTIDWESPTAIADANRFMRRRAYEFVTRYLEGGNRRLSVYRDSQHPTFVAEEFESMVERLPSLAEHLPDLRRYLLDYPQASLPGASSFLYWQEVDFGLKPTVRINHVVARPSNTVGVVAIKMLYASHYFWTALDLRVLVPDPARGKGFWLVTLGRSRSDGLTGFTGFFIRRRVRSGARSGALKALLATKARLEE